MAGSGCWTDVFCEDVCKDAEQKCDPEYGTPKYNGQ